MRTTKPSLLLFLLILWAATAVLAEGGEPEVETATFSMYCYWTGEATVGRVDGVLASRIGHWGGDEIIQVDFDPQRTNVAELAQTLQKQRSFDALVVAKGSGSEAAAGVDRKKVQEVSGKPHFIEPKHSLRTRHPKIHAFNLTEEQAIALNSWSYFGGRMPDVLSAEQKQKLVELGR